jgi:hypothetical protein
MAGSARSAATSDDGDDDDKVEVENEDEEDNDDEGEQEDEDDEVDEDDEDDSSRHDGAAWAGWEDDCEALEAYLDGAGTRFDLPLAARGLLSAAGFRSLDDYACPLFEGPAKTTTTGGNDREKKKTPRLLAATWLRPGAALLLLSESRGERYYPRGPVDRIAINFLRRRQYRVLLEMRLPHQVAGHMYVQGDRPCSDAYLKMANDLLRLMSISCQERRGSCYHPKVVLHFPFYIYPRELSELVRHDVGELEFTTWGSAEHVQALSCAAPEQLTMNVHCADCTDMVEIGHLLARNVGPSHLALDGVAFTAIGPDDFRTLARAISDNAGRLRSFRVNMINGPQLEAFLSGLRGADPLQLESLILRQSFYFCDESGQEALTDAVAANLFAMAGRCPRLGEACFAIWLPRSSNVIQLFIENALPSFQQSKCYRQSIELTVFFHEEHAGPRYKICLCAILTQGKLIELEIRGVPTFIVESYIPQFLSPRLKWVKRLSLESSDRTPTVKPVVDQLSEALSRLPSLTELCLDLQLGPGSFKELAAASCLALARKSNSLSQIRFKYYSFSFRNVQSNPHHSVANEITSCLLVNSYRETAEAVRNAPYLAGLLGRLLAHSTSVDLVYMLARKHCDVPLGGQLLRKRSSIACTEGEQRSNPNL